MSKEAKVSGKEDASSPSDTKPAKEPDTKKADKAPTTDTKPAKEPDTKKADKAPTTDTKPAKEPPTDAKPEKPKDAKDTPKEEPAVPDTVEEDAPPEKFEPRVYTPDEIAEIDRRVETFTDVTPDYTPQHVLSPEYNGTSNYEEGIRVVRQEIEDRLRTLQKDPNASKQQLSQATEDLKTLDHLYENYNIGMNVFRSAHGGRSKLRQ